MRLRDGLVIGLALLALSLLGVGMVASAPGRPTPEPSLPPDLPTPPPAAILRVGALGRAFSLDPLLATTPAERFASSLLFRGLTRLGPDGTLLPDVASGWDVTDDGVTVTFHLRPDVHWHDGALVDADDVIFTVGRLADASISGPRAADWEAVTVERVDRFTVRMRLPLPLAGFLSRSVFPLLPAHLLSGVPFETWGDLPLKASGMGNGRFRLDSATDTELDLVPAAGPRGGEAAPWPLGASHPESTPAPGGEEFPRVDGITVVFEPDLASLASDMAAGAVDLAAALSPEQAAQLTSSTSAAPSPSTVPDASAAPSPSTVPDTSAAPSPSTVPDTSAAPSQPGSVRSIEYPTTTVATLIPNLRFSDRPLSDVSVRQALSSAIDRDAIVRDVLGGAGVPVQTLVPPGWPLWDATASGVPQHDVDAAVAALEQAGWERATSAWTRPGQTGPATIELLAPDDPSDPELAAIARRIADDWRALGLVVNVVQQPSDRLVEFYLRPGDFDVALIRIDVGLEPDLHPLLVSSEAQVGGTNLSGYQSGSLDRLLEDARRAADPADRASRWQVLQAALRQELPVIPVAFTDLVQVASEKVVGPESRLVRGIEDLGWDVLAWRLASGPDE